MKKFIVDCAINTLVFLVMIGVVLYFFGRSALSLTAVIVLFIVGMIALYTYKGTKFLVSKIRGIEG